MEYMENDTKNTLIIAFGFMLIFDGLLFGLINSPYCSMGIKGLWPLLFILAGLSFFASDFYIFKRLRTVFLFPSVMLIVLGVFFLMFSLHVIPVSFKQFVVISWPYWLIVLGLILVLVYGMQRIKDRKFPYMQDDSLEDNL